MALNFEAGKAAGVPSPMDAIALTHSAASTADQRSPTKAVLSAASAVVAPMVSVTQHPLNSPDSRPTRSSNQGKAELGMPPPQQPQVDEPTLHDDAFQHPWDQSSVAAALNSALGEDEVEESVGGSTADGAAAPGVSWAATTPPARSALVHSNGELTRASPSPSMAGGVEARFSRSAMVEGSGGEHWGDVNLSASSAVTEQTPPAPRRHGRGAVDSVTGAGSVTRNSVVTAGPVLAASAPPRWAAPAAPAAGGGGGGSSAASGAAAAGSGPDSEALPGAYELSLMGEDVQLDEGRRRWMRLKKLYPRDHKRLLSAARQQGARLCRWVDDVRNGVTPWQIPHGTRAAAWLRGVATTAVTLSDAAGARAVAFSHRCAWFLSHHPAMSGGADVAQEIYQANCRYERRRAAEGSAHARSLAHPAVPPNPAPSTSSLLSAGVARSGLLLPPRPSPTSAADAGPPEAAASPRGTGGHTATGPPMTPQGRRRGSSRASLTRRSPLFANGAALTELADLAGSPQASPASAPKVAAPGSAAPGQTGAGAGSPRTRDSPILAAAMVGRAGTLLGIGEGPVPPDLPALPRQRYSRAASVGGSAGAHTEAAAAAARRGVRTFGAASAAPPAARRTGAEGSSSTPGGWSARPGSTAGSTTSVGSDRSKRGSATAKPMLPWMVLHAALDEVERELMGDLSQLRVPPMPLGPTDTRGGSKRGRGKGPEAGNVAVEASLFARVFRAEPQDSMGDDVLAGRAHMLRWATAEDFGVPPGARNPVVVDTAAAELRAMARARTPGAKLARLDRAMDILARAVSLARRATAEAKLVASGRSGASGGGGSSGGEASADDLVPALSLAMLRSGLEAPYSELLFIDRFRDEDRMLGRWGWLLATAQVALGWLANVTPAQLGLTDDEFRQRALGLTAKDAASHA